MKFLWLFFMPLVLVTRSLSKISIKWNAFVVLNWVTAIVPALVMFFLNSKCFFFLFGSAYLSQSFHPANARITQRHLSTLQAHDVAANDPTVAAMPNTFSYYGPMNLVTLNVGYHVEHHDFARVPWPNLPILHRLAGAKWYPKDLAHQSRSLNSVFQFVWDTRIYLDWFSARQPKKGLVVEKNLT